MDFLYLLRILLKRKWLIVGAGMAAAVIAYVLTMGQPKKYRSYAQFSTGFTINDEVKIGNDNADIFAADVKFNNVIATMTSPSVVSLLSYNLILHDLQSSSPFKHLSPKQLQSPVYRQVNQRQAIEIYRNKLNNMTQLASSNTDEKNLLEFLSLYGYDYKSLNSILLVQRYQHTDYMEIDCISENPDLSAYIVNTLFPQFLRYYKGVRSSKSNESIDTLQSLMDKKKQELDARNKALVDAGVTADMNDENSSNRETVNNLISSLTEAQSRQTQITYDLQKVNQRISNLSGGPAATNKTDNSINDELVILRRNMNDAYQAWLNSGKTDAALEKKYENLKTDYQAKVASSQPNIGSSTPSSTNEETRSALLLKKGDLEADLKAANQTIDDIQGRINALKGTLSKDASKSAMVETLIKDAELANREYLAAKQKYSDAVDITSSSVNNFRLIIGAQPAIDPEPSKRLAIVGMAGASAFIITILVLVLLTYLDSSIKTPVIFSKTVGLKLISLINFMNLKAKDLKAIVTTRETTVDAFDNKRHNQFREALRKLRFEIEHSGKKILLFASTKKGEGKTTLIQALSYSLSMSKKNILIIDTNFCNPDLTAALNADPILEKIHPDKTNSRSIVEQVRDAATKVGDHIFAIGSEGGDYTPSEVLPRENLLHHLQALTAEFDYIFLEGPPLNDFTDSKELVQYVDGVIAIFSANHIIKQIDRQSMMFFNELNGKFVGAVLNMVDLEDVNTAS